MSLSIHKKFSQELIRVALVVIFLLAVSFMSIGQIESSTPSSSELGFSTLSPRGVSGGVIVPASCESGYTHFLSSCPTASVGVSPNPVSYGGNPAFTLYSTNAYYCYVYVDGAQLTAGYFTSGNFYKGAFTSPGTHYASAGCYNLGFAEWSGWSYTYFTVNSDSSPSMADIKANGLDGPITIPYNSSVTISWTGSLGSGGICTVFPDGWTDGGPSGTRTETLTASKTYDQQCSGPLGTARDGVTVNVIPLIDYTLSNSGTSFVTKTSGDAFTQNTITKTLTSGTTQSVTLFLSGVPAGTSYSISDSSCSPTCTSVITFTVGPSTLMGTYPITVTGSPLDKQTSFNLVVSGNPMTISCSATPATALISETVTWTTSVSGGTSPFTYSWSGTNIPTNPAPNTNPFSIIYSTLGQKTATVTVTDANSVEATCPAATVWINFTPQFEEF